MYEKIILRIGHLMFGGGGRQKTHTKTIISFAIKKGKKD